MDKTTETIHGIMDAELLNQEKAQTVGNRQAELRVKLPMTKEEATEFFAEIYYGEHHIPSEIKAFGNGWSVNDFNTPATHDYDSLTRMVFLAHDKCYRLQIQQGAPRTVKIIIWKRYEREGDISKRHPTIEMALEKWRKGGHRSV